MVPLLFFSLACNLSTQLASSPLHLTNDLTTSASSADSNAACNAVTLDILRAGTSSHNGMHAPAGLGVGHQVRYLVLYDAEQEELGTREDLLLPDGMDETINSRTAHQAIWQTFTSLIPEKDRSFVTEFAILSDGRNNVLAGVSPTYDNPREWTLKVDVVDAGDPFSLTYSLLHEHGHLLTLNSTQVPPDEQVFYHPDDRAVYENAMNSCPQYFTGEGCSHSGSYINEFFSRYWNSFHAEWQEVQKQEARPELLHDFYSARADQFLTSYAATSPEEDIAESWAFFVLSPKPEPISIANQKILFFYEYPELVALRQEILKRLCTSFAGR